MKTISWECEICGQLEWSQYVKTIALKRHCRECGDWFENESSQTKFIYLVLEHPFPHPFGVESYLFEKIRILRDGGFDSYYIKQSIADSIDLNCRELAAGRDAFISEFQPLRMELRPEELEDIAKDSYGLAVEVYKAWLIENGKWGERND